MQMSYLTRGIPPTQMAVRLAHVTFPHYGGGEASLTRLAGRHLTKQLTTTVGMLQDASVLAKTCQASSDLATKLRIAYARSPWR